MQSNAGAEEVKKELDEVSVTATRIERKTAEVPASIAVISEEQINDTKMFNVKEALTGTPGVLIETTNQGYDSRLIIRGAGLKAAYGVREIMVLRDGVPVTDPDGMTRLDMVDTQNIERIEVVKGPNSTLWGANASGGVINIITKNPLERKGGTIKLGAGDFDTYNLHASYTDDISEKLYYSASLSRRETSNSWRRWNEFETTQLSVQPYVVLDDGSTWENNISYSKADLQLSGSLDEAMFQEYLQTGEANQTTGQWQYSGRYSDSYFVSSKVTKELGDLEFIPLVYVNYWEHHHPVTGRINDAETWTMGTDFQFNYKHKVASEAATMTVGITVRFDDQKTEYYKYADIALGVDPPGPSPAPIDHVLSDAVGDHMETQTREALLYGLYVQESFSPVKKTVVDVGARVDVIDFKIISNADWEYNWGTKNYGIPSVPYTETNKSYTAFSPRIGANYELTEQFHTFISASTGVNTPSESEINDNPNLEMVETQSYELGLKGRGGNWTFDSSVYYSPVKNEVVKVAQSDHTDYVNAGKTLKKGFEFAGSYTLLDSLNIGTSYTYSDYTFEEFNEPTGSYVFPIGMVYQDNFRNGNRLPYIPVHQYSLFASYKHQTGFKAKIQSHTWGSYYMDNANTEKYEGYDFVTNLMLGYETSRYDFSVNIDNLFDDQYAVEVTKDLALVKSYKPGAPRTIMARVNLKF